MELGSSKRIGILILSDLHKSCFRGDSEVNPNRMEICENQWVLNVGRENHVRSDQFQTTSNLLEKFCSSCLNRSEFLRKPSGPDRIHPRHSKSIFNRLRWCTFQTDSRSFSVWFALNSWKLYSFNPAEGTAQSEAGKCRRRMTKGSQRFE